MTERGQKIVFGPARFFCRNLRRFHLANAHLLADVASNFEKPADVTVLVSHRRDHDFSGKDGAVFAHTQSLFSNVAVLTRHLQVVLRFSRRHVLGGVKASEVFSDNFIRAIPLDLFRTGIPRRDATR